MAMTIAPMAVSTALSFMASLLLHKRPGSALSRARRSRDADHCDALHPACLLLGLPRLIIRRRRLGGGKIKAALGPIGRVRAGRIRNVRLLPFMRLIAYGRGRFVDNPVHPAVPPRRNGRCLGIAIVGHPAPAVPVLIIMIAELIGADETADQRGIDTRADGGAVPPGEEVRD